MQIALRLAFCALALCIVAGLSRAEQIRLADGRYLQGDVVEVKEDGFTFKLTDTGGKVFLRWTQVGADLKKRLTNDKDPDEDLKLLVEVPGARLELFDGTIYEGDIREAGNAYRVVNRDYPKGKTIAGADVLEDGFITDIMIEATVMMSEKDVLKFAEEERAPLEQAIQYYELARIADSLGLYTEAKDYVTLALAAGPDTKLETRLAEYDAQLVELIRQQGLLNALTAARQLAKKKKFQTALDTLAKAKEDFEPKEGVLVKWEATLAEIDLDFTRFVITGWYKQMRPVIRKKVKEDGVTFAECIAWTRRDMDGVIGEAMAASVGSEDPADMRARFDMRFDLETAGAIRLPVKKASFGQDGFYQLVDGHLNNAGKKPQQQAPPPPGRNDRRNPRRPREGSVIPGSLERVAKGQQKDDGARKQDISHLKEPAVYPSLQEWWDSAGLATRSKWIEAFYVLNAGTMSVVERNDWDVKYK